MCLAVPGLIQEMQGAMAVVDMGGLRRRISLQLVPEARIGDYVQIHTGYAIAVIDRDEAEETLRLLRAMAAGAGMLPEDGDGA
jgi:hydrogenase expression/formation protein HypC